MKKLCALLIVNFTSFSCASGADNLESAISNGHITGNLRMHYNSRHYPTQPDASAFAVGGGLRAETGALGRTKLGVGFYTAQDLGTNHEDPARVDTRMGSELEVLGEAYINVALPNTSATLGRQKIVTPFANPIDIFLAPFTYEGFSIKNNSIDNLTLDMAYVTTIKSAGSDEFVDVGRWSTARLGVDVTDTSGTLMLGGTYANNGFTTTAWFYEFSDLFNAQYLQAAYDFTITDNVKPFIAAQVVLQQESGDALLGKVDTTLHGLMSGVLVDRAKFTLGYNHVNEQDDAFKNGAFLAPYNFSSSPLFTNNMLLSMENMDAGDALKFTFNYYFPRMEIKLSYAQFDFAHIADRDAIDFDIIYDMSSYVSGLSLRYRLESITSDSRLAEQSDHRLQLQYAF